MSEIRFGGLATGLDTDTIVADLMKVEEAKVFKIEQEKQIAEWQQEAYRDVIDDINEFMSSNFDITNSKNNILSSTSYKSVELSSSAVSMIANGDAVNGTFTIDEIERLATASTVTSSGECKGAIVGAIDLSTLTTELNGQSFDIRLDGVQKTITFTQDYVAGQQSVIRDDIQAQLDDQFGTGRVVATLDGNNLKLTADNSVIQVLTTTGGTDALATLGLTSGDQNTVNTSASLATVFGEMNTVEFSINDVSFSFAADTSVAEVMETINESDAGVSITYNTLDDAFTLQTKETGASASISIKNTSGSFFGSSSYVNIVTADGAITEIKTGQDAKFYMNGDANPIYRSTNTFSIDNVTMTLKATSTEAIDYTVQDDLGDAKDKIVKLVDEYNMLIDKLHGLMTEKRDYDYQPLSDDEKEAMSDDEVEKWEEKAKAGLLKGDSTIRNIYNNLRQAFTSPISGSGLTIKDIGLDTGSYSSYGKITIDEFKLDQALKDDVQAVMDVFAQSSDISYSRDLSSTERTNRFNEVGFAQRINDILKDNVSTKRNEAGYKGTLLEKAGIEGDTTEFTSSLSKIIEDIEERIDTATERMYTVEERYWSEFTALEVAISRMNSQSDWLMSQF